VRCMAILENPARPVPLPNFYVRAPWREMETGLLFIGTAPSLDSTQIANPTLQNEGFLPYLQKIDSFNATGDALVSYSVYVQQEFRYV